MFYLLLRLVPPLPLPLLLVAVLVVAAIVTRLSAIEGCMKRTSHLRRVVWQ
jgi:hypothetical protein